MAQDPLLQRAVAAVGDEYDIEAEIGRGGMAVVYRARDRRLRRHVAIKVLPPDLAFRAEIRSRFLREAETAAGLSHPHIVPIYSFGERAGVVFFVMGLVVGPSLAEELHHDPRLPVDRVRRILIETADALDCAHRNGVVHRDIKPDNILLDRESGRAMVTDFGIARAAEGGERLTQTGIAVGTPTYMSPEQALGEREIDGRADVYSLGAVGYQMLTGRPPFDAASTPAMLMKHISEPLTPLAEMRADLPQNLAAAIDRALAKAPADRWPTAAAFRDALAADAIVEEAPRRRAPQEITPPGVARTTGASIRVNVGAPPPPPRTSSAAGSAAAAPAAAAPSAGAQSASWEAAGVRVSVSRNAPAGAGMPPARRDVHLDEHHRAPRPRGKGKRSLADEIAGFHRNLIGSGTGILTCWAVNLATGPEFLWAIFPTIGMGIGLVSHGASVWSRGVPLREMFSRRHLEDARSLPGGAGQGGLLPTAEAMDEQALRIVGREVLAGPYGQRVRHAIEDRAAIRGIIERLPREDRALLPDIAPTVDALIERVGILATTLHRLGEDIDSGALARLDERIAALGGEGISPDRERTRGLLERQRASVRDLLDRRERLVSQLESAGLVLQNLKLDLLKLRSGGLASSLDDVTSATQEARALSRDIGHVVDAAAQVRGL